MDAAAASQNIQVIIKLSKDVCIKIEWHEWRGTHKAKWDSVPANGAYVQPWNMME